MYFQFFFISWAFTLQPTRASPIFISPTIGCSIQCSGTSQQPYDNLWAALFNSSQSSFDIRLLNISGSPHYMFYLENFGNGSIHTNLPNTETIFQDVSIRPLFCNDAEATSLGLQSSCYNIESLAIVYVKSENFTLIVNGSLTIQNIEFSWIEDIEKYNPGNPGIGLCIYNRILCCPVNGLYSNIYSNILCNNPQIIRGQTQSSFFVVNKNDTSNLAQISLYNCRFQNFNFEFKNALLGFDNLTSLNFQSVQFLEFDVINLISNYSYHANWVQTEFTFNQIEISQPSPLYNSLNIILLLIPTNVQPWINIENSEFKDFKIPKSGVSFISTIEGVSYKALMQNTTFSNISFNSNNYEIDAAFMSLTNSVLNISNSSFVNIELQNNCSFIYYGFDSTLSVSYLRIPNLQLNCQQCQIFSGYSFLSFQLSDSSIQNSRIWNGSLIFGQFSKGQSSLINLNFSDMDLLSFYPVVFFKQSDYLNISNLQISNSEFTGEVTFLQAESYTVNSSYQIENLFFMDSNLTQDESVSDSALISFLGPQAFIIQNLEILSNNITYFQKFFYIDQSKNLEISNTLIANNHFRTRTNSEFSNFLFVFMNSEIASFNSANIYNNTLDATKDQHQPFENSHHYSLINFENSEILNFTSLYYKDNLMPNQYDKVYNLEVIETDNSTININGIDVQGIEFIGGSFLFAQRSNITITNFNYSNNENAAFLNVIQEYSSLTASNLNFENNLVSTLFLFKTGQGKIVQSSFNNNQVEKYKNFQGENQEEGYGIFGLFQKSNLTFDSCNISNTYVDSTFTLFLTETSSSTLQNLFMINITINSPGLMFKAGIYPICYFYNITYINVKKENAELTNFRPLYRFLTYLYQANGEGVNQTYINSDILWILTESSFVFSTFTISNIQYKGMIPMFLYNFQSQLVIQHGTISNLQSLLSTSDNLISTYSGNTELSDLEISNIYSNSGTLLYSQDGTVSIKFITVTNVVFLKNPLLNMNRLNSLTMTQSHFTNTRNLLQGQQIAQVIFTSVTFSSNVESLTYVVQLLNTEQLVSFTTFNIEFDQEIQPVYVIDLEESVQVRILSSTIQNTNSEFGALHILQSYVPMNILISNSNFQQNIAKGEGAGALYLDNILTGVFTCSQSIFSGNQATVNPYSGLGGRGGAVALYTQNTESPTNPAPVFNFEGCAFTSNLATIHGGAIYVYGAFPNINACTMTSNSPNNIGSQAYKLQIIDISGASFQTTPDFSIDRTVTVSQVLLSSPLTDSVGIAILDVYDGIVFDENDAMLTFYPNTGTLGSSVPSLRVQSGIFSFKDISLYSYAGTPAFSTIGISNLLTFPNVPQLQTLNPNFTLVVNFRDCSVGEIYNSQQGTCTICPYGLTQMSGVPNYQGECSVCDSSMICEGGSQIGPAAGYWMMNVEADIILPCPETAACPGGVLPTTCAVGYMGNLCNECQARYGRRGGGSACYLCQTYATLYVEMFFKGAFLLLKLFIFFESTSPKKGKEVMTSERVGILRSIITYLQLRSLLGSIFIKWPGSVVTLTSLLEIIANAQDDMFGVDCFFSNLGLSSEDKYYHELILFVCLPIIIFCGSAIFVCIFHKFKWVSPEEMDRRLVACVGFMIFLFYPAVSKAVLGLFSCINIYRTDHAENYLQNHYDIQCWTKKHLSYALGIGVPFIIIWIIGIPTMIFIFLRRINPVKYLRNSFLTIFLKGYRRERITWEVVNFIFKLICIGYVVFGRIYSASFQIYILTYFFFVWWAVNKIMRPSFLSDVDNIMELGLCCVGMVALCGIFFELITVFTVGGWVFIAIAFIFDIYFVLKSVNLFLNKTDFWIRWMKRLEQRGPLIYNLLKPRETRKSVMFVQIPSQFIQFFFAHEMYRKSLNSSEFKLIK